MDMETMIRKQMVKGMVQRAIFCPYSGEVLDVRTCVVLVDRDGDPAHVMSPTAWKVFQTQPETLAKLAEMGYSKQG